MARGATACIPNTIAKIRRKTRPKQADLITPKYLVATETVLSRTPREMALAAIPQNNPESYHWMKRCEA